MNCQLWIYEWWSITTFSQITESSWMKKPQGFQAEGMDFVNPRGPALTSRPWRRDPETHNPTFVAGDLWLLIHEGRRSAWGERRKEASAGWHNQFQGTKCHALCIPFSWMKKTQGWSRRNGLRQPERASTDFSSMKARSWTL